MSSVPTWLSHSFPWATLIHFSIQVGEQLLQGHNGTSFLLVDETWKRKANRQTTAPIASFALRDRMLLIVSLQHSLFQISLAPAITPVNLVTTWWDGQSLVHDRSEPDH